MSTVNPASKRSSLPCVIAFVLLGLLPFAAAPGARADATSSSRMLRLEKSVFAPRDEIVVSFSGLPGNAQDWITVVKAADPATTFGQWFYTAGKTSGSMTFNGLPEGEYEVRLYFDWPKGQYDVQDRIRFRVGGAAAASSPAGAITFAGAREINTNGTAGTWTASDATGGATGSIPDDCGWSFYILPVSVRLDRPVTFSAMIRYRSHVDYGGAGIALVDPTATNDRSPHLRLELSERQDNMGAGGWLEQKGNHYPSGDWHSTDRDIKPGEWYKLTLTVDGTKVTGLLDGKEIYTADVPSVASLPRDVRAALFIIEADVEFKNLEINGAAASTTGSTTGASTPPSGAGAANAVIEDDISGFEWHDGTPEVRRDIVSSGSVAFRSTGNNHFFKDLGRVGDGAGDVRYIEFDLYLLNNTADLQLQIQNTGSWGNRWGFDAEPTYNGYMWGMAGTTVNMASGRWHRIRKDLITDMGMQAGNTITGLAFSSQNGDALFDRVLLLPQGAPSNVAMTVPSTANLALGKPVVDAKDVDWDTTALTDGKVFPNNTGWTTQPSLQLKSRSSYATIDLGAIYPISRIVMQADCNDDYYADLSDDGLDWKANGPLPRGDCPGFTKRTITLSGRGRYVRIRAGEGDGYNSVAEVEVYGPAASSGSSGGGSGSGGSGGTGAWGFIGVWNTTYGPLTILNLGGEVRGLYPSQMGAIKGRITGNVLEGEYKDNSGRGTIRFILSDDGRKFTGSWTKLEGSSGPGAAWNGEKVEVVLTTDTTSTSSTTSTPASSSANATGSGVASFLVTGTWKWSASGGKHRGEWKIAAQDPSGAIAGEFGGTDAQDIGAIAGTVSGDRIIFTRKFTVDGRALEQRWTGRLKVDGSTIRVVDGRWEGDGGSGDVTAERTNSSIASTATPSTPSSASTASTSSTPASSPSTPAAPSTTPASSTSACAGQADETTCIFDASSCPCHGKGACGMSVCVP